MLYVYILNSIIPFVSERLFFLTWFAVISAVIIVCIILVHISHDELLARIIRTRLQTQRVVTTILWSKGREDETGLGKCSRTTQKTGHGCPLTTSSTQPRTEPNGEGRGLKRPFGQRVDDELIYL